MKKITAIILAACMLSALLLSCGGDSSNDATTTQGNTAPGDIHIEDDTPAAEVRIEPDLPDDLDFGGYVFTFLSHREGTAGWDWVGNDPMEIIAEEETGDPINDAVYQRNAILEGKYNFTIDMLTNTDEVSLLRRTVNAGDDVYQAAIIYNNNVPGAVQNDLLTEIGKMAYIDLEKPWWDDAVNGMSVLNKNFLLAGDLLILDNEATDAIIFNKDMMRDMGYDLPYNDVLAGKWTFDMLHGLTKDAGRDLNGDGLMTHTDDQFGFIYFNDTLQGFLISGGGLSAAKDDRDVPYMDFTSQKNIAILEKAMDLMFKDTNPSVFNTQSVDAGSGNINWMAAYYAPFQENRALFMWIRMRVVEVFRGMDADFGILPMPKYDETQDAYRSLVNPYTGVLLGVPKSVSDLDRTGIILEAICAESKYTLQPAYYDVVLQRKFTRDEESSAMLDIIFTNRVYDIGTVYAFGDVAAGIRDLVAQENRNIMSYYERRENAMQTAITRLVDRIEGME